jgi:hypothetical protein
VKDVDWQKVRTYEGRKVVVSCGAIKTKPRGKAKPRERKRRNLALFPPLGNMKNGWALPGRGTVKAGIEVGGRAFENLECAYICGVYSGTAPEGASAEERARFEAACADIQERIRLEDNGLLAKQHWRFGRGGDDYAAAAAYRRTDWDEPWHYEWMLFLWTLKIRKSREFRDMVRCVAKGWSIVEKAPMAPKRPLEEPTGLDAAEKLDEQVRALDGDGWGCVRVRRPDGSLAWVGRNHFGVIAMECAAALHEHRSPEVDVAELRRRRIRLFGAVLSFEDPEPFPKDGSWDEADRRDHARRAGSRTSERKKATSAANGRLGGRPRKIPAERPEEMPPADSGSAQELETC